MKTIFVLSAKFLFVAIMLSAYSCESFVEVELPKSQLTSQTVFEEYETADAALKDIYASIRSNGILTGSGGGISNQIGNYTDELTSVDKPNNPSLSFYNNAVLPSNTYVTIYWNVSYNQIYAANSIIEGVAKSKALSDQQKRQLHAEALFIRSLLHFYLANLFGDVPYITGTDFKKNSTASRTSVQEIYENIIKDLEDAAAALPVSYSTNDRVRPNRLVVKALLARVYLYNKSYPEASNTASAVINEAELYAIEPDVTKVFLINSTETIWQLQAGNTGLNTLEASFFTFNSGPPSQVSLSNSLVNSFNIADQRRLSWIKTITNGTSTWYHAFKYKENNSTSASREYSIIFRLAEQYLIRAEARAEAGDLIGAKEDLNVVRHRAGLGNTQAVTQQEILRSVLEERRWELFTEFGHRFFDLKRTEELDNVLSGVKIGWKSTESLLPIPQTELSANLNLLPQNPGY